MTGGNGLERQEVRKEGTIIMAALAEQFLCPRPCAKHVTGFLSHNPQIQKTEAIITLIITAKLECER